MKPSFKTYSITSFLLVIAYFVEIVIWAWINPSAQVSMDVFMPLVMLTKIVAYIYMMFIPLFWMAKSIYRQILRVKESIFVMRMAAFIRAKMHKPA